MKYFKNKDITFTPQKENDTVKTHELKLKDMFKSKFAKTFSEEFKSYLIEKYKTNDWWNSDDTLTYVYHQTNERRLAIDWGKFQSGVDKIIGRTTTTLNYASRKVLDSRGLNNIMSYEEIQEKVKKKWEEII